MKCDITLIISHIDIDGLCTRVMFSRNGMNMLLLYVGLVPGIEVNPSMSNLYLYYSIILLSSHSVFGIDLALNSP